MGTILPALGTVLQIIALLVASQALLAAAGRRVDAVVPAGAALGGPLLWKLLTGSPMRTAALALFWALCICLFELNSLLCRGYSLRILIDLAEHGGTARVCDLKTRYGGGRGLRAMLLKRLDFMSRLGLVRLNGPSSSRTTAAGSMLGALGRAARGFLRLDLVG